MAKKTPHAIIYLRQLTKPELFKLAEKKKVRIPSNWPKAKIVETLATIVNVGDVTSILPKMSKSTSKEVDGIRRVLKGKSLEDKVVQIYTKKGFQCEKNIRLAGMEIDVFGVKKGGWLSSDEFIIVECKNKAKVIPEDFKKFVGNMSLFVNKKGLDKDRVQGFLITTGIFDKDTKTYARSFPNIALKRVKL